MIESVHAVCTRNPYRRSCSRLVLVAGGSGAAAQPAAQSAAQRETVHASGLTAPVEIVTDRWGISHIYAENEHDLFFAQGYAAARDRLFQFEIWRRRATGTVAEILGPRELERDISARLFRFRGDMATEMRHYHERGGAIIRAFVAGINAYVDRTAREPGLLPIEFELLGIEPGHWTPEVVVSRHQGLVSNVAREIDNARAVAALGPDAVAELNYYIGDPDLTLDPAIDAALLTPAILDRYHAHRRPIVFRPDDVAAAHRGDRDAFERLAAAMPSEADLAHGERDAIGSNNWVVHGSRTLSGYPLMANDPHRVQSAPSLRYWVHLVAPGWNVIGGGEPVLPGVSIGHNEHGAWGLTVFGQDNEDLYVYETDPADPNRYRHLGGWEPMTVLRETIPVQGQADVEVELKYTRHGPVVFEDPANRVAYAVAAAWLDYGSAPYLASLRMDQATTWEEFVEACSYSRIPSENMVWADRAGNIGYQAVGVSPIRPHHSGLLPVPGDGRYEWDGLLPIRALPQRRQPAEGLLRHGEQLHAARRARPLSALGGAALYLGRPDARGARRGGAGQRAAHDGRRQHAVAARRAVRRGPQPSPPAARPRRPRRSRRPRAPPAARLGRRARQGRRGGGDLRELGAGAAARRAPHRGARGRPRLHPQREHQAPDRLARRARRPVRRRPHRGPRRPAARRPRGGGRRPRTALRHRRRGRLALRRTCASSTPSSAIRSAPRSTRSCAPGSTSGRSRAAATPARCTTPAPATTRPPARRS